MNNLYGDLSRVYEAMYQTFINYEEEYAYYSAILNKYSCHSVAEIGCGTGQLAQYFSNANMDYVGIDLSEDMLHMARLKNPAATFVMADMRLFKLNHKVDSAMITGRTISYLITNNDVFNAFVSIGHNMNDDGILVFDCIDASKFIPLINGGHTIEHKANFGGIAYRRISKWKINLNGSWLFDWNSGYEKLEGEDNWTSIGTDDSTIRTFTKEDIDIFLNICGYEILELHDRDSYAFDTFVVVAKKK